MNRREFITLLGGAAVAWPRGANAQQAAMPLVGWLASEKAEDSRVVLFREGLKEGGYSEGQNVTIEYRFADGHYDRLPALAADLVHRPVNVIALTGQPAALAAKAATTTIPIVFQIADDPVQLGLVASLSRPGGNMTGITSIAGSLGPKRMELMREFLRDDAPIGILINPANPLSGAERQDAEAASRSIGQRLEVFTASNQAEIEQAFASLKQRRISVLIIAVDTFIQRRGPSSPTKYNHGVENSRRILPINLCTYPFCHGGPNRPTAGPVSPPIEVCLKSAA